MCDRPSLYGWTQNLPIRNGSTDSTAWHSVFCDLTLLPCIVGKALKRMAKLIWAEFEIKGSVVSIMSWGGVSSAQAWSSVSLTNGWIGLAVMKLCLKMSIKMSICFASATEWASWVSWLNSDGISTSSSELCTTSAIDTTGAFRACKVDNDLIKKNAAL